MKIGIDWTQSSTWRGLFWLIGGIIALLFLSLGSPEKAGQSVSIIMMVAGGLGVAIKDK